MVQRSANGVAAILLALLASHCVQGQQFADFGVTMATDWSSISPSYATALNATISCSLNLYTASRR